MGWRAEHWDRIWEGRDASTTTWYQATPGRSLELVLRAAPDLGARIVDIGGGASTLVDHLVALGYRHVAVLDVAPSSLDLARRRLGAHADRVTWVVGDVLDVELPELVDVWHDRAVFHFLTEPDDVENYARRAAAALRPGGTLVIGTFALDGPDRCSGLPVVRYDASSLSDALGGRFDPEDACDEVHVTPTGATQHFQYATFRRR